jgi:hypothetical protein
MPADERVPADAATHELPPQRTDGGVAGPVPLERALRGRSKRRRSSGRSSVSCRRCLNGRKAEQRNECEVPDPVGAERAALQEKSFRLRRRLVCESGLSLGTSTPRSSDRRPAFRLITSLIAVEPPEAADKVCAWLCRHDAVDG